MHSTIIPPLLLLTAAVCSAAPFTDEQLLEKIAGRATALEEVTKEPVLMPNHIALLCRNPTAQERADVKNNPHLEKYSRLFTDKAGRPAAEGHETTHPEGTLLIKEKLPAAKDKQGPGTTTELFTGMLKREQGYNPECGDWEFFTVSGDAKKVTARGKLANCMGCHQRYADQDFTSRDLVPDRIQKPGPDGSVLLHSKDARVFGRKLRYEPQAHKNTLGYWTTKEDTARWQMELPAGHYEVEVLQGCGQGSGGAVVQLQFESFSQQHTPDMDLKFTVEDTGHFQNFKPRVVGTLDVKLPAPFTLTVVPQTKPGAAVMDLRQVVLRPVAAKPAKP